jgi:hypothetical protein
LIRIDTYRPFTKDIKILLNNYGRWLLLIPADTDLGYGRLLGELRGGIVTIYDTMQDTFYTLKCLQMYRNRLSEDEMGGLLGVSDSIVSTGII